jgi:hypothetical protein
LLEIVPLIKNLTLAISPARFFSFSTSPEQQNSSFSKYINAVIIAPSRNPNEIPAVVYNISAGRSIVSV